MRAGINKIKKKHTIEKFNKSNNSFKNTNIINSNKATLTNKREKYIIKNKNGKFYSD